MRRSARILSVEGYALILLAAVALVEIVLGRTHLIWKLVPDTDIGGLLTVEKVVIASSPGARVLIFGSSRGREAFLPAYMEELMGLRRGQVLSLAMGGVNVLDALLTYERNRSALSRARAIILQLDPFQLTAGQYPPPLRYREFASWSDRLAYHGRARALLFADYLFGMDKALPAVSRYVKHWLRYGRAPSQRFGLDEFGRLYTVGAAPSPKKRGEDYTTEKWNRHWLRWAYPDYQYSDVMEGQLKRLVEMAKADGVAVYAVYMPTTESYLDLLRQEPGDPYGQFRARLTRLATKEGFQVGWWESPSAAGLTERDFIDWGHLNTAGAQKWTAHIARWLGPDRGTALLSRSTHGNGGSRSQ